MKSKKPIVIGLVAPKEAGKTTVTNMLAEFIPIRESAFADKLKNTCSLVFNIPRENFDRQDLKEVKFEEPKILTEDKILAILDQYKANDALYLTSFIDTKLFTPRHIAQLVGTELLRECVSPTVHIDNVIIDPNVVTVISDTRFVNEYEEMAKRDDIEYYAAYIYRKQAEEQALKSDHKSETEFFQFKDKCYIIDNNSSFRDLELNVKTFLDKVMYGKVR
jgi:hypothetical protein